jgi:hypothetical protein
VLDGGKFRFVLTEIFQRSLLLILLRRFAVHKVVEALAVLEEIVDTTHDAEDTERENLCTS